MTASSEDLVPGVPELWAQTNELSFVVAGHTTEDRVRLLFRSPEYGPHVLRVIREDTSGVEVAFDHHPPEGRDFVGSLTIGDRPDARLEPDTDYRAELIRWRDGHRVGSCAFRTSPVQGEAPERFAIAVASCHQPFLADGALQDESLALLRVVPAIYEEFGVVRTLLVGDQVYGDQPPGRSLFSTAYFEQVAPPGRACLTDCTREEIRALYQGRHRTFFSVRPFLALQTLASSHAILDDHEIVDNFGSDPKHASPEMAALGAGALDAFHDYQAARQFGFDADRPAAFYHSLEYGPLAVFVMDLRSERHADDKEIEVYSDAQHRALEEFLRRYVDHPVIGIVMSVPILHVPDWMATLGAKVLGEGSDAADRWSYAKARPSRDRLLALLADHQRRYPNQRVVLLGGDVHVGLVSKFEWRDIPTPAYQLVSSAISNKQSPLMEWIAEHGPKFTSVMGELTDAYVQATVLDGVFGGKNPVGALNIGLMCFEKAGDDWVVRLRLAGADPDDPRGFSLHFESEPL